MNNNFIDKLELNCKSCGGAMQIDTVNRVATCQYCGNTATLVESENVTIAKIELAQQEMEIAKLKLHSEKSQEERLNKTRKSFFTVLTLILAVMSALVAAYAFSLSYLVCALIASAQAVLFFSAWLIRMRFIKGAAHRIHTLVTIVALVAVIPFLFCMDIQYRSYTKYTWPSSGLSELVPQPKSQLGELMKDNGTTFIILIGRTTIQEFDAYVDECKNRGFVYEQSRYNSIYEAYNEDGTYLSLSFNEYIKEIHIEIEALPEMKEYEWNTNGLAGMLPKPKSNLGFIENESVTYFEILIAQVDRAAYVAYVAECIDAGFDIDVSDYDDYFSAENSDGYQLVVKREYGDIMSINIYIFTY